MKTKYFILLFCLAISQNILAQDKAETDASYSSLKFSNFKLTDKFKQNLETEEKRFDQVVEERVRASSRSQLKAKTMGTPSSSSNSLFSTTPPNPNEEQTPLYNTILKELGMTYTQIGTQESANVLKYNKNFDLGVTNFSGFTWQKPMGSFFVGVDRQIVPDVSVAVGQPENWIVRDKFIISIYATTLLQNMRNQGEIEITDTQLALFAGIMFKRVYTYTHFAPSYEKAMTSNYAYLFMSFMVFRKNTILGMNPYEVIEKQDFFAVNAGGAVKTPTFYGFSASAGVLVEFNAMANLKVYKPGPKDQASPDEILRINSEKGAALSVQASASVLADFYNILQITLLRFDFSYKFDYSHKTYLSFYEKDKADLQSNSTPMGREVLKMLLFIPYNAEILKNNLISDEVRKNQEINAGLLVLIAGGTYKNGIHQLKITRNGVVNIFYEHYERSQVYLQNIFSKILDIVMKKFLFFSLGVSNVFSITKEFEMQYQFTKDIDEAMLKKKPEEQFVRKSEDFSAYTLKNISIQFTRGMIGAPFKDFTTNYMANFTNIKPEIIQGVEDEVIHGPINIMLNMRLDKRCWDYFIKMSDAQATKTVINICSRMPSSNQQDTCYNDLAISYNDFMDVYKKGKIWSLWRIKKFINTLRDYSSSLEDIEAFFGKGNVFYNGVFSGRTQYGRYQTYFYGGNFKSLNLVDQFLRGNSVDTSVPIPYEVRD